MGQYTAIEYVDSTSNAEIGCAGCELWQDVTCKHCGKPITYIASTAEYVHKGADEFLHKAEPVRTCYAGQLVTRYAGQKGYPLAFDKPQLFLDRLLDASKWPDLRGKDRPSRKGIIAKPWLNGLPRFIFLNDLGDTFTEGLPHDWLGTPALEFMGLSPLQVLAQMKAIVMVLTKRATQMRQFFERYECPNNFIVMTSITGPETITRVRELLKIKARWHGVSAEPILADCAEALAPYLPQLSWCACGLESGVGKRTPQIDLLRTLRDRCATAGTRLFVKQIDKIIPIPDDLLVRQLPDFELPS